MTSSETPGTISRIILGAIVAALSTGIMVALFSGIAGDGLSREKQDLGTLVDDVNSVCDGAEGAGGGLPNLENFYINRSDNEKNKVYLVSPENEIKETREVECIINNEFRVSDRYKVSLLNENTDETLVKVSKKGASASQGGLAE
ncbi:MAG: hypothetical protein BRC29_01205 [Nanohaloarchaea archaeon SW_7_43_1]|nr:MAG: hypothetical protein BRC29_01205 [Nanohaloarchaea archaeon SW_7_43_1]